MELYIVTKSSMILEDGYYDEKTKQASYRRKDEFFETKEKAFVSYIKAAKYIRELLVEENEKFGGIFEEKDMELWNVFFIGFHHECTLHCKIDPLVAKHCKSINVPPPRHLVRYKIKTVSVDYEILDEREEILKGLA